MSDISGVRQKAKAILDEHEFTFVLLNADKSFTSDKNGIMPIMSLLQTNPNLLSRAVIADKVIGRAAALLLMHGNIAALHANVISESALAVLKESAISVSYDKAVPVIQNRTKEGMCPMEASVFFVTDPERAFQILQGKLVQR